MTRAEINVKFDEIVDFAASAVSRHTLETLLTACLRGLGLPSRRPRPGNPHRGRGAGGGRQRLSEEVSGPDEEQVATSGRTVVFVSHDLAVVRALCTRCALLDAGQLVHVGEVDDLVDEYVAMGGTHGTVFTVRKADEDIDGRRRDHRGACSGCRAGRGRPDHRSCRSRVRGSRRAGLQRRMANRHDRRPAGCLRGAGGLSAGAVAFASRPVCRHARSTATAAGFREVPSRAGRDPGLSQGHRRCPSRVRGRSM